VGGLVGQNKGTIQDTFAVGPVTGSENVGGLIGYNEGSIENGSASGTVNGSDYVGGLVGQNEGLIQDTSASGTVNGSSYSVGGLVGQNGGLIQNISASGTVDGYGWVGGVVGYNFGSIRNASASGIVNGSNDVGGLVGSNYEGTIQNASASGNVNGSKGVGGLVGYNRGSIQDTFAVGPVTGSEDVGGLVGYNESGSITDSYWDVNTTGQATSADGTPLTTAEMTGESARTNMTGLAFGPVWTTQPGDYPELRSVPAGESPQPTLKLVPAVSQMPGGSVTTFDVVLTNVTSGVGAYEGQFTVHNETIGSITGAELYGDPERSNVTMVQNNSTVMFNAASADTVDTGRVVIASINVRATREGESRVSVRMDGIETEAGSSYQVDSSLNATLNVTGISKLQADYSGPPADIDGDGVFEDINGDGEFNIIDIQALYFNRKASIVQSNQNRFDVNGNGGVNIVDAQALYDEYESSS